MIFLIGVDILSDGSENNLSRILIKARGRILAAS